MPPKMMSIGQSSEIVTQAARSVFGPGCIFFEIERRAKIGEFLLPDSMTADHVASIFEAAYLVQQSPIATLKTIISLCSPKVSVKDLKIKANS